MSVPPSRTKEARRLEARAYYAANRERLIAAQRQRYQANKRAAQNADQMRKYGITLEQKEVLLLSQGGRCGICATDDPGRRGWFTDHCHTTNAVRGVLCHHCNSAIGLLQDDPAILAAAIAYLTSSREDVA